MDFSYLWLWDRQLYLAECKKYGRPLTVAEREAEKEAEGSSGVKVLKDETNPPLSIYKEQVCKYFHGNI